MESFTKLVDLLKASGWQLAGIAAACFAFWWCGKSELLPGVEGNWLLATAALGFISAGLSLASLMNAAQRACALLLKTIQRRWRRWQFQKRFISEIPYMDDASKRILGYLRHNKLKHFDIDDDGGYAAGLLGSGYVHFNARGGQTVDPTRVPATVHEAIWPLIEARPEAFPHMPQYSTDSRHSRSRTEVHPWRIPWQLR